MTPKEKAEELVDKFENYCDVDDPNGILDWQDCLKQNAKNCALIAVEEILDLNLGLSNCDENNWETEKFYKKVKEEILKL